MRRTISRRLLAALGIGVLLASVTVTTALASRSDLNLARAATARFNSLTQAEKVGYGLPPEGPLHECIASFDDTGAMGFHYINGALLDGTGTIDPTQPEALVYAEDASGNLRLVALEYVVFDSEWTGAHDPMLFDEMFMFVDEPNRYELPPFWALHVWLWEDNPAGTFAAFNPDVSC
jgi:hypothetical protein